MEAAGGGTVLIPANNEFITTAALQNKTGVTIRGEGWSSVIKTLDATIKVFNQNLDVTARYNYGWENFRIIGAGTVYVTGGNHAINLLDTGRTGAGIAPVRVHDMWFEAVDGDGLYIRSSYVDAKNIHCKNCYRQGVSVTDGDYISIDNVRGEGTMITLVDIEPSAGDFINYLTLNNIRHVAPTIPALRIYEATAAGDVVNNVVMSNIETNALGISSVTNLAASNIIAASTDSAVSLSMGSVKKAVFSNVVIPGAALTVKQKVLISACENVIINGLVVVGGSATDMDILSCTNVTINDLHLSAVETSGVRIRQSAGTTLNNPYIADATYAVYMDGATVANSKTKIKGINVVSCTHGLYLANPNGNTYIDGDLTGATTPVSTGGGYTGQLYYGELIGVSPLIGTKAYTITAGIADGVGETTDVTVTGAALGGGFVSVDFSRDLQGITVTGYIKSANTVSVRFQNESGGALTIAAGTLIAYVRRSY
jgi:hypothetical protein